MRTIIGLVLFLAAALSLDACGGSDGPFEPRGGGVVAADFALVDLDGRTVRLSDFEGKAVIVDFWASWCGPCRMETPGLAALATRYEDHLAVILVTLDAEFETVRSYFETEPHPFVVLAGTSAVTSAYGGVRGIPTSFVLRPDRSVYAKFVGYRAYDVMEEAVRGALGI